MSPITANVPVYNLTTSDGTYFANGVLVHNCDAMSQALSKLGRLGATVRAPAGNVPGIHGGRMRVLPGSSRPVAPRRRSG